ncbi:fungal-specific transcription factor domain-containing protein [Plectosphaerella plurivora]|uniref:Fungal-specific transcription factor domain-containing protein n=1 Tax=Plectosphaerella plurivora TaxID=936078 RepID=A0A9P9ABM6_9PEZI|nr:fungal-specific transcription factor domain-containing protein [Plectosphaerella plurivora]
MSALKAGHSSRSLSSRACVNCQKRKSRCVRSTVADDSACTYCARSGKPCSFETPPDRTPLTRRNLDAAEARCAQLTSLLRSLHPELDIEASLTQSSRPNPEHSGQDEEGSGPTHEFEWHEPALLSDGSSPDDPDGLGDGMANLATSDAGYLGSSSGSKLLEEITAIISHFPHSPQGTRSARKSGQTATASTPSTSTLFDPPDLVFSAVTEQLIDAYFLFFNRWYPILDEASFRQKAIASKPGLAKTPWRVVYYMVLAIGHWTCTTESDHVQSGYYAAARSSLSISMLEAGTIETLQSFLLMGYYLQKRNKPNTGYNLIGIAVRMALGMGLHRESSGMADSGAVELQRRLFYILHSFDTGFNITTGRPPSISTHCIDTKLPQNIDDRDPNHTVSPVVVDYPTTCSSIIAHGQLVQVANLFYSEFLLAKSAARKIEYQVAESIDRDLIAWETGLPAYFHAAPDAVPAWFLGPRAALLWKQQNLRILLWRGSIQSHPFLPAKPVAERRCLDIAMKSACDISDFCATNEASIHQVIVWYATYFLFQAALVLEESFFKPPSHGALPDDVEAREYCLVKARECLGILAQRNRSAARCLEIVTRLHTHLAQLNPGQDVQVNLGQNQDNQTVAMSQTGIPHTRHHRIFAQDDAPMFADQHLSSLENTADDNSDATLRMLINQTALEYLNDSAMDMLLEGWEGA